MSARRLETGAPPRALREHLPPPTATVRTDAEEPPRGRFLQIGATVAGQKWARNSSRARGGGRRATGAQGGGGGGGCAASSDGPLEQRQMSPRRARGGVGDKISPAAKLLPLSSFIGPSGGVSGRARRSQERGARGRPRGGGGGGALAQIGARRIGASRPEPSGCARVRVRPEIRLRDRPTSAACPTRKVPARSSWPPSVAQMEKALFLEADLRSQPLEC